MARVARQAMASIQSGRQGHVGKCITALGAATLRCPPAAPRSSTAYAESQPNSCYGCFGTECQPRLLMHSWPAHGLHTCQQCLARMPGQRCSSCLLLVSALLACLLLLLVPALLACARQGIRCLAPLLHAALHRVVARAAQAAARNATCSAACSQGGALPCSAWQRQQWQR